MANWKDIYEWSRVHPAYGRETRQTREQIQVALWFRSQPGGHKSGQYTANILGISRERVRQLLARAKKLYQSPQDNINWTVYHWLLENYPDETSVGQRCRALESLQLKADGLSYKEIANRLGGKSLMHSTRCAWARKTHRRAMAFFVELMSRLVLICDNNRTPD